MKLRFVQTRNGQLITSANEIERLLVLDLHLPFNCIDSDGTAHPGRDLNELAEKMFSVKNARFFNAEAFRLPYAKEELQSNKQFIEFMLKNNFVSRQTIREHKLDCYTPEFVNAVIQYLCGIAGKSVVRLKEDINMDIVDYSGRAPIFDYRQITKQTTIAKPLFLAATTPANVINDIDPDGTVKSTFPVEHQAIIDEYFARCKNTEESRRRRREQKAHEKELRRQKREEEKNNGKTGCSN